MTKDKKDGKPIWVSACGSIPILFHEDMKIWTIGCPNYHLSTSGGLIGTNEENRWRTFDGESSKELGKKDIIVECIARKGKYNSVL